MKSLATALLIGTLLPLPASPSLLAQGSEVRGFYRFPALHGESIVFAAEGDLWTVSTAGGIARRLTTHAAEETDPVVSPDGRTLAFTARYEGPAALYTMPVTGGSPRRWTYESEASIATTWTPDGKLVYTTTKYSGIPKPQLVSLDLSNGARALIPLAGATDAEWDASGRTLYFVRPAFHNNVTKRYTGGTARDVWKFAQGSNEAVELTGDYNGESHSPMWFNNHIYFVSDRDGTMNIWSMNETGGDLRQLTKHSGWDVRHPSLHSGRVVYQLGADLWLLNIASGATSRIDITLQSDLDQLRENWVKNPMEYLSSAHLSPEGDRIALTSRGRVFVAPVGSGRIVRASRKDSVRFREAVFAADGKSVLALGDETGEFEFTRLPLNGVGADERLTTGGDILRFVGSPSPDGKLLAWYDNNRDLWIKHLGTGNTWKVSENREGIEDVSWSPDSRWLAFAMTAQNTFTQIKLHSVDGRRNVLLTSNRTNSMSPAWDPKGEFIYFLSDRNLKTLVESPWGARQPEPYFDKVFEVYEVALRSGLLSPFQPQNEIAPLPGQSIGDRLAEAASPAMRIDEAGLSARIRRVPVSSGNYRSLQMNADALFYLSRGSGAEAKTDLVGLRRTGEKPTAVTMVEDVRSVELSGNGKKMLVRKGDALHVLDARPVKAAELAASKVDLAGWSFSIDVRQDWRQIFVDAWRLERDWFYDPKLHGVDYQATLAKYLPLVDRITTREELSDLIGWAVGELSALHTSVRGGDVRRGEDNVSVGSLGARLFKDPARGGFRIDYIYQSDPDYPLERSPLADPDLAIRAGDVITAINGASARDVTDIGELLRNQANRQVLVTVSRGAGTRDVVVTPIGNESALRYTDWEYTRRLETEQKGKNAIGYVHLRAMGGSDVDQWYREFYPVFDKQGIILDMRHNNGGNIDSFILEKLMRKAWMYWQSRVGEPYWNMPFAFRGHMVVLVDQETASDGEAFAEGFRRLGLGTVVGARTWGGEIWLGSQNRLTDGGLARAPMDGVYGAEGKWLIEQEGFVPDVIVDNLPHATFNGSDAQLEAAIAWLQKEIARDPRGVPAPPAYPVRVFKYPIP